MRNTRDSHAALNGTEIPEDEKFRTIWGNELRYPGDPEAPAAEVINCFCVLVPDVKLPRESTADRLRNGPESGIIEGEGSPENAAEKAAAIEKEFRYTDVWGDSFSPIDRASFAAMPTDAQQQAAAGIRKAKELFGLNTLPEKIGFKKLGKGTWGEYSETYRELRLSSVDCKDPEKAFRTAVHELTHYYDHVSGHIAEKVYKQALKELGLRENGKEADTLMRETIGYFNKKDVGDPHEIIAFGIEKAVCGKGNILARKLLEIVAKGRK